jgi:hypothetical protein
VYWDRNKWRVRANGKEAGRFSDKKDANEAYWAACQTGGDDDDF